MQAQYALRTGVQRPFPAAGLWLRRSTATDKLFSDNLFPRLLLSVRGRGISGAS